jgi:hypothetical protein
VSLPEELRNGTFLDVSFEAFIAVTFKVEVFWVVTSGSVVRHSPNDLDFELLFP